MEEKEVILTQEGFDKIEKELEYLRTEKRTEIAERIKVALGFGDLSENSEYAFIIKEMHLSSRSTRLLPMFFLRLAKHFDASISCILPDRSILLFFAMTQMYVEIPVL